MRKWFLCVMTLLALCLLTACRSQKASAPTCEALMEAYQAAGYHVFHDEAGDFGGECCVKVWMDDENDYAFFYFFASDEAAEAYAKEREYNIFIYLFSVIYGDPAWLHTETYGNIEYEYENADLLGPFQNLTK